MNYTYLRHLASAVSLITVPASWRALGATSVVEERRSKHQVEADARTLSYKAEQAKTPNTLLHMPAIKGGLLTAAGVKREDAVRLDHARRQQIVAGFVENVLVPVGAGFVEALVNSFVQQSHALGEINERNPMRAWTQRNLVQAVIANLRIAGRPFQWLRKGNDRWQPQNALWDCTLHRGVGMGSRECADWYRGCVICNQ